MDFERFLLQLYDWSVNNTKDVTFETTCGQVLTIQKFAVLRRFFFIKVNLHDQP